MLVDPLDTHWALDAAAALFITKKQKDESKGRGEQKQLPIGPVAQLEETALQHPRQSGREQRGSLTNKSTITTNILHIMIS